jgi:hypothetical protein
LNFVDVVDMQNLAWRLAWLLGLTETHEHVFYRKPINGWAESIM